MPAKLILRNQVFEVESGQPLKIAMKSLGILVESHLAMRGGELITENEVIRKDDEIQLIAVISGG